MEGGTTIFFMGLALCLIISGVVGYIVWIERSYEQENKDKLCFTDEDCIFVEIFSTPYSRQKGLMHRPSLEQNTGAFFVFDGPSNQTMWMMNMAFPIDIVFFNKTNQIVKIHRDAKPCIKKPCELYPSMNPATHAVEMNAGDSKKHNLREGMKVRFPALI